LVKMVNALTSKSSIGGPMACMYLLGHPDVYRSHDFRTIYWTPYIKYIKDDYALRPTSYDTMPLWDWWRLAKKYKSTPKMRDARPAAEVGDQVNNDSKPTQRKRKRQSSILDQDSEKSRLPSLWETGLQQQVFLSSHSQYPSHHVNSEPETSDIALNLAGAKLPRRDQGNREEYCMIMLIFFKPWRTGKELKSDNESWQHAYENHEWTIRQSTAMQNMHIKYECNDARDDYNARLKENQQKLPVFDTGED
ncbi:uncharacterized protein STEHIDRAFT_41455, partial [Stereum hirsutum FP-91666 SS1]